LPLFEIDEGFFARVKLEGDESRQRRQERARDRQTREDGRRAIPPEVAPQPVPGTPSAGPGEDAILGEPQLSDSSEEAAAGAGETSEILDSEAPEDAHDALEMESEAAGEDQKGEGPAISESGERSRRRRRRRRGRRGRGRPAQASPASVAPSEEPGPAGGEVPASPAPEREAGNGEAH
jgi:hypothetical protein